MSAATEPPVKEKTNTPPTKTSDEPLTSKLAGVMEKAAPAFETMGKIFNKVEPYFEEAWDFGQKAWKQLQPYHPEEFLPAIMGLLMAFFGGYFVTTIAAVEAYRMMGWETTYDGLLVLYENYKIVLHESAKDDKLDEDNDGIADVKQISNQELATRKLQLVLKSCDPLKVTQAMNGIYAGLIAVLATLRVQFARAITLGATIGNIFSKFVIRYVKPVVEQAIPAEYHKWIGPILNYICKAAGVSIAWMAVRILSAVHSGIRGGQIFVRGITRYLVRHKYIQDGLDEKDPLFLGLAGLVGATGVIWQVSGMFSLPFPLNIFLLPFTIFESILTYLVADSSIM